LFTPSLIVDKEYQNFREKASISVIGYRFSVFGQQSHRKPNMLLLLIIRAAGIGGFEFKVFPDRHAVENFPRNSPLKPEAVIIDLTPILTNTYLFKLIARVAVRQTAAHAATFTQAFMLLELLF
jgi:hypothetical protein